MFHQLTIYYLVPKLWKRERLYSLQMVNFHFWTSTIGIVIYITAMWVSGIMQGLMWRAYNESGFLTYSFAETVAQMHPYYVMRAMGGAVYLLGVLVMVYNVYRTIQGDIRQELPVGASKRVAKA